MGFPPHRTQNSIRVSLGAANTDADAEYFLQKLPGLVSKLRMVTGVRR
jgi:cysteine sulfinate desulfinase/cysteine desulfurase-like protein